MLIAMTMLSHLSISPSSGMLVRRVLNVCLGILIGFLSVPVVMNLLSSKQVMNTSFDPLRIVTTYGAFGRYDYTHIHKHTQTYTHTHTHSLTHTHTLTHSHTLTLKHT